MQEIRCKKCGKLLFKIANDKLSVATKLEAKETKYLTSQGEQIEIECKCPRCKAIHTLCGTHK